jgi:rhodanese-related sulfurtransferase
MIAHFSPKQLREAFRKRKLPAVIDVREPWEFKQSHIEGAEHIPLKDFLKRIVEKHPNRDEQVVVYCDSGIRSHLAAILLRAFGYKNAFELDGGLVGFSTKP